MQVSEKRELKAILASDLTEILQKFSQYDDFVNNKIKCDVCQTPITTNNVGSIRLVNNNLLFTCNKSSCYNAIVEAHIVSEKDKTESLR